MTGPTSPLRILCIGETWFGSDARSAFAALRRLGHSTEVIDEAHFVPTEWESLAGRVLRKAFRSTMVSELTHRTSRLVRLFAPDALFVFKGNYVTAELIRDAGEAGARTVNYYPDVSFMTHGPQIPRALPYYDHVFTAKSFGIADMRAHGVKSVSLLAPGFDPEVHRPMNLTETDRGRFGCDVSFIGTWSPKKEKILSALRESMPGINIRIWGNQWEKRSARSLDASVMGMHVTGDDYARAICASRISLGLLSEARTGASSGDLITARTFQIPACGAFMLHERTDEALGYFTEDVDAAYFGDSTELAQQVARYLENDATRIAVAEAGRKRSLESDYSIDERMTHVASWIRASREGGRTR
jgi:spore maturation protein CgeB